MNQVQLRHLAMRIAYMAACAAVVAGFGSARGDVFSDVHFWLRGGMAVDANANGRLDTGEIVDSMGRTTISSSVSDADGTLAFTNELVRMPMRGLARELPALYLPQKMVITNEVTGAGYMRSNAFTLNNVFNGYTDKYSFIVRFRPDAGRPSHRDYAWILKIGYGGTSGMLMGLAGAGETRAVRLLTSQASWGLGSVTNTAWTEVGVAVDGTNFAWVVSSTTGNNETDANIKHLTTQYGEFVGNNKGVSTRPSGELVVGTENPTTGLIAITNTPTVQWSAGNYGKAFRGSIQQIAFWKRALTLDELREALAWPNPDVLKIGVQDDSSSEFAAPGSAAAASMDDREWNVPSALAAGGSQTFAFQLKDKSNSAQSQVFRWIATSDSASGIIRVTVNGKTGPTGIVRPGERTRIFLDGSFFRAGANELTVTRVDAGAQPLRFDAVVLGGSWTVGLPDRSYNEFAHERSPTANYWTLDGNWKSVRRAFLGSGSGNTNQVWHFSLPDDLAGRYAGRLTCGVVGNSAADTELSISYDGVEFAHKVKPVTGDEFVRDLDASDLAQGVHRISLVNGKGPTGNYWGPDFVRLDLIAPPNGTMLILR